MAFKKIFFLLTFLEFCSIYNARNTDNLAPKMHDIHSFEMIQDKSANVGPSRRRRDLTELLDRRKKITKRDADDGTCQKQEDKVRQTLSDQSVMKEFIRNSTFANETKYSMALSWVDENKGKILVVTTEENQSFFGTYAKPSTVYLSQDDGKSFKNISERVDNAFIRKTNGVQKHPLDSNTLYLVAYKTPGTTSLLYITNNGADTFHKYDLPFMLSKEIVFHPKNKEFMLAHADNTKGLYLSRSGGETWNKIHDFVIDFKWGVGENDGEGTIYLTTDPGKQQMVPGNIFSHFFESNDNELRKSVDYGDHWETIKEHVYTFGLQGKFLYSSRRVKDDNQARIMEVSTDSGKTWNEAQLPTIDQDRFYSILDMSEDLIFMHVDNPGDTGHGTLYTSDATGIIFSQSLEKHLYPNYRDITDFYKVNSMRGVYLASQMSDDQSIRTMITFNRGAEWNPVRRPQGAACHDESKPCYLQIHNQYSIYRGVLAQSPLSISNAVGIIIVHGHVADSLQTTDPDVFVSSDGGYNWYKSLDGPHHYQIADHGGLIVAVPSKTKTPKVVKFSTDEGRCWHEYEFTKENIVFTGLLTEPGNKAMSVGIWGFGELDRKWRVHVVDFTKVIKDSCGDNDYEEWVAHSEMHHEQDSKFHGCLLGKKEVFKRLKKDSMCKNGYTHEVNKQESTCECTYDDYECDFAYIRKDDKCVKDPNFKPGESKVCVAGHEEKIVTSGYRKIPGDVCVGGTQPAKDKEIDLNELCNEGDKTVIIKEELPMPHSGPEGPESVGRGGGTVAAVVIIVIVLLIVIFLVIHFGRKYNFFKRRTPSYRYSMLNQSQEEYDYDNELENALANTTSSVWNDSDDDILGGGGASGKSRRNYDSVNKPGRDSSSKVPKPAFKPGPTSKDQKVKSYHDDSDDDLLE
ncbi:unnamed protein product [Owenia fusiformis]|uniref:VPS10 domain-containing protein n=1 Tax=Owenia fusiformis TaxID=6347 RepID=A0A8S4NPN8_OWEFU|nr:unnamed protein product [Owenia fusiformis]